MLTPSQHRALRTDQHLSVTANAGSGKTLVLVERYVGLVASGLASPGDIVAITFTEKAAAELKRKISDAIAARLTDDTPTAGRQELERAREQLPSAVIGTIHGFCARLLREFPVEAGIDASFSVIEPVDQEALVREAVLEAFRDLLRADTDSPHRDALLAALRLTGKKNAVRIVTALTARREIVRELAAGLYARPDDMIIVTLQRLYAERLERELHLGRFRSTLTGVLDQLPGKGAAALREEFKKLELMRAAGEQAGLLSSILDALFTQKGEIRKALLGRNGTEPPDTPLLKEHAAHLRPLIDALLEPDAKNTIALLTATRALLGVFEKAARIYDEKKTERGNLDFDDLQIRTRALLAKPPVRERLSKRYRSIMVDEYQDTNRLQYEILRPLVDDLRSGNLFIVGDPKQSIYGFRDADVRVFEQTRNDIVATSGDRGAVVLGESFRPLGAIAAFVNLVFDPLMKRDGGAYDVSYDPLIQARVNPAPGSVTLILRRGGEDGSVPGEGETIARYILTLRCNGLQVYDRKEEPHPVRFSDIAILLRSRSILGDIEQGLVRHGIPHVVSGGIGYFQTQTVFDFYNYFRFLLNAHDDVALAGILRAPFFSVSDAEVYEAAGERDGGSLWSTLCAGAENRPQALRRALRMLREDLATGLRMTTTELLERIVDRTGYEGVLGGIPGGEQGAANLRKLRRLATSYERRGMAGVHDFVRRLDRLVEEEEREGQGAIDLTQDAVRVMTIHAAKGLEFPVVIVPGLEKALRPASEPFLEPSMGIGFSLNDGDEKTTAPLTGVLKAIHHARDLAEEKRIFYVACTGARDHIILSGLLERKPAPETRLGWVLKATGVSPGFPGGTVERTVVLPVLRTDGETTRITTEAFPLRLSVLSEEDRGSGVAFERIQEQHVRPREIHIEPVPGAARGELFSASSLRTYEECPALYYLRYVLGVPAHGAPKGETPEEEESDPRLRGDTKGIVLHAALERSEHHPDVSALIADLMRAQGLDPAAFVAEIQALRETVEKVFASEFWLRIQAGTETRTEYAITASLGEEFVTGTIDRMFKESDGVWHVVDYKTDTIGPDEIEGRSRLYESQIDLYAFLVSRLFGAERVRCSLLFTRHVDLPQTKERGKEDLDAIGNRFARVIARIKSLDFKPLQPSCPACPFAPEGCCPPSSVGSGIGHS